MHVSRRSTLALPFAAWSAPAWAQGPLPRQITVPLRTPFDSLDPPRQFDLSTNDVVGMLYSTLLRYSYLERPYKLEPGLLATMPESSADHLSHTFRLRQGVRFHDNACFPGGQGRELTADDVLYSLRRFADARINNKSWFTMAGAVVGLDDYRAATAQAAPDADLGSRAVAGLVKIDRYAFAVRLVKPNPLFLYALAITPSAIVPVEAVRHHGDRFGVNPVGSGAFMLAGPADRKGVLRLVKNPRYWNTYPAGGAAGDAERGLLKDAGQRLPLLDAVEMPLIVEAQPSMLRFLNGEIDWQAIDRANFTKMAARGADGRFALTGEYAKRFDLALTPALTVWYYSVNMKDALLGGNKALRQALAHLVDSQAMIDVLLNGRGQRAESIVPPELPGAAKDTGTRARAYDPEAARRLLAAAGYAGGRGLPALTITHQSTDADTRNRFDLMRSRFAQAGVVLKGLFMDYPTFAKTVEAGNFQIADYAWNADYPDAEDFYQLLYGRNAAPGPNIGSFANAAYDAAYEASRHAVDSPERRARFKLMDEIVREESPILLNLVPLRASITQKWLRNFKRNLLQPEFEFLDVDVAARTRKPS